MGFSMACKISSACYRRLRLCPAFTRQPIPSFEARGKPWSLLGAEGLIEPLSARELEILALLDDRFPCPKSPDS